MSGERRVASVVEATAEEAKSVTYLDVVHRNACRSVLRLVADGGRSIVYPTLRITETDAASGGVCLRMDALTLPVKVMPC